MSTASGGNFSCGVLSMKSCKYLEMRRLDRIAREWRKGGNKLSEYLAALSMAIPIELGVNNCGCTWAKTMAHAMKDVPLKLFIKENQSLKEYSSKRCW